LVHCLASDTMPAFDSELVDLEFDQDGMVREALLSSAGRQIAVQAQLYVAADGIGSRARQTLFPGWSLPQARVPEIVGLVRSEQAVRWANSNFNKFHGAEGGVALGVLPVGPEYVVWFLQFDSQRYPPPQEEAEVRREFVYSLVGQWVDPIPSLLTGTDFSSVHLWLPVDAEPVPRFNQGNLVLVGDAGHPLLPFTSQGVSSAVADAEGLARILGEERNLARALSKYSEESHERCQPYVAKGRKLMQDFLQPVGTAMELPIA
jgi:salicylate hydroxylase